MKYIAQGVNKLVDDCGLTKKAYQVIVLDLNILSASEVEVIDEGITVWTAHEYLSN